MVAGEENLDIQILEEEDLPDIDETDMIHGLDHTGIQSLKVDTVYCFLITADMPEL